MKINISECVFTSLRDFLLAYLGHAWLIWLLCVARSDKYLHPKTSVLCNSKSLWLLNLSCSSYSCVERLFRIDQAEVMPRLKSLDLWGSWAPQYYPIQEQNPSYSTPIILNSVTTSRNDELAYNYPLLIVEELGSKGYSRLINKSWNARSWIDPPVKALFFKVELQRRRSGWPKAFGSYSKAVHRLGNFPSSFVRQQ